MEARQSWHGTLWKGKEWYCGVRFGKAVKVRRVVAQRGKECLGAERKQ